MTLQIGITGGIGSGKTTICRIFETIGIPVYYADIEAKRLMVTDKELINKIKSLLGDESYLQDGTLNRAYVASQVFGNAKLLEGLNALVHPAVHKDADRWHQQQKNAPYTLKEAALIFESGNHLALDAVITVFADRETRIQRVLKRDQIDREAVAARIDAQLSDEEKVRMADFVITNNGKELLIPQVNIIHQQLIQRNNR